jgi:hypothetical protein
MRSNIKSTPMKTAMTSLLLGLLLAALTPFSHGFVRDKAGEAFIQVHGKTLHIGADSLDFPSGGAWWQALSQAIDRWNDNPSEFQFTLSSDSSVDFGNGESEIWFSSSDYWLSGGEGDPAPAICYNWADYDSLGVWNASEADILVDVDRAWETSGDLGDAYAYGNASFRFLQTTLLHELGHALGLNHEDRYYNIMGQSWNFLTAYDHKVHFYPGEDACSGVVTMYSRDASAREDVSVTHWIYAGTDGTYSQHERCRIFKADGVTEVSVESGTEANPMFEVSMDQTIQVQLTYENSGYTYALSPHISYYLSDDEQLDLDGTDTLLATRRPTLNRNRPFPFRQQMVIPTGLTVGATYRILIFVDDLGEISEANELNNKTFIRIRIH